MTSREEQFEQLSAYLDGELSADEALDLEAAIQTDEVLAAELESLRQTRKLLRQLPAEPAPEHFTHAVMARAEKRHHLGRSNPAGMYRSWRWIQLATAAVVLIAAGLGLVVISQMTPHEADEQPYVVEGPRADPLMEDETRRRIIEPGMVAAEEGPLGGEPILSAAPVLPEVVTEVIYTDDLAMAQQQVEAVLAGNSIRPVEWDTAATMYGDGLTAVNSYQTTRMDGQQIRMVVNVELEQVGKLRDDLMQFRNRQSVAQVAAPPDLDAGGKGLDAESVADEVAGEEDAYADSSRWREMEAVTAADAPPPTEDAPPAAAEGIGVAGLDKTEDVAEIAETVVERPEDVAQPAAIPESEPDLSGAEPGADPVATGDIASKSTADAADTLAADTSVGERADNVPATQQVVIYLNRAVSSETIMERAAPVIRDEEAESRN